MVDGNKADAFIDLSLCRFVLAVLLDFFSEVQRPVTCWTSVALDAGVGIDFAYTECSQKSDGSKEKIVRQHRDDHFEDHLDAVFL
ncbi:hypothetical protein CASFOL_000645 [Castilleja foliolosa]|uniref:Uncharacterized protein n=1 Tax=Castilleja foliolosa TaxID=1961234 RepID=A0ABD3EP37_9LAMI